jgi:heme oxygenase
MSGITDHGGDVLVPRATMVQPASTVVPLLSASLRARTAALHRRTEVLLGLPTAIRTRHDYTIWLGRFLGLYEPLEQSLAGFPEWEALGIVLPARAHTAHIANDLAVLGVDPCDLPRTPPALLPNLPTFAHALGGLYVLETATLEGSLILHDIETRTGSSIAGATSFFDGRGDAADQMWQSYRAAVDTFGRERPWRQDEVVFGARRVFRSILEWFAPLYTDADETPPS